MEHLSTPSKATQPPATAFHGIPWMHSCLLLPETTMRLECKISMRVIVLTVDGRTLRWLRRASDYNSCMPVPSSQVEKSEFGIRIRFSSCLQDRLRRVGHRLCISMECCWGIIVSTLRSFISHRVAMDDGQLKFVNINFDHINLQTVKRLFFDTASKPPERTPNLQALGLRV